MATRKIQWGEIDLTSSTVPGNPVNGMTYFDTTLNSLMYYDATRTKWLSMDNYQITVGHNVNTNGGDYLNSPGSVATDITPVLVGNSNVCLVAVNITTSATAAWTLGVTDVAVGGSATAYTLSVPSGTRYSLSNVNQNFNANDTVKIGVVSVVGGGNIGTPVVSLVFKKRK